MEGTLVIGNTLNVRNQNNQDVISVTIMTECSYDCYSFPREN